MPRPQRARRTESPKASASGSSIAGERLLASSGPSKSRALEQDQGSDAVFGAETSWANVRARISPRRSPQRHRNFDIYQDISSPEPASSPLSSERSPSRAERNDSRRLKRSPLKPLTTQEALKRMPAFLSKSAVGGGSRKQLHDDFNDENSYQWASQTEDEDGPTSDVEYGHTDKHRKRQKREQTPQPSHGEPATLPDLPQEDAKARQERIAATKAKFAEIDDFELEFEDISSENV